jgi:hypothetical protein
MPLKALRPATRGAPPDTPLRSVTLRAAYDHMERLPGFGRCFAGESALVPGPGKWGTARPGGLGGRSVLPSAFARNPLPWARYRLTAWATCPGLR